MALVNKNSMLPTYQGNYSDMVGAIKAGDIDSPCLMYLLDRNDLAFIHWEKNANGYKVLVPRVLLWDKISVIEEQLDGLVDPETGEPVNVVEYVQPTVQTVEQIKEDGATYMLTSDGGAE